MYTPRSSQAGFRRDTKPMGAPQLRASNPSQFAAENGVARSLDYMTEHLDEPVSICTLCAIAGYSQSRYFDLFKRTTGDTPLNWFIRARMRWAGELLKASCLPVKQIASQVGYEDQFYFSRLFKSVHGVSPSEYRVQPRPMPEDTHGTPSVLTR